MFLSLLDICVLHSRKKCLVHAVRLGEDIAEEISSEWNGWNIQPTMHLKGPQLVICV